ncbi:recombinase zinc beta ribbon domain-containing protein [Raineyella sp. W15-4]|uniref:recombinase zinc beta ribbon domain-containing protein n=1 Tax=Raineyella sp. W15-4 TaxID=3081651 RepID=UPI003988B3EE
MLAARRSGARAREHLHYLKGTVFCLECGRALTIQHTRNRHGTDYTYFHCAAARKGLCAQTQAPSQ